LLWLSSFSFCVFCADCCCSVVIPAFGGIAGCWRNIGLWIAFCSSRRMATAAASHPALFVPKVSHWGGGLEGSGGGVHSPFPLSRLCPRFIQLWICDIDNITDPFLSFLYKLQVSVSSLFRGTLEGFFFEEVFCIWILGVWGFLRVLQGGFYSFSWNFVMGWLDLSSFLIQEILEPMVQYSWSFRRGESKLLSWSTSELGVDGIGIMKQFGSLLSGIVLVCMLQIGKCSCSSGQSWASNEVQCSGSVPCFGKQRLNWRVLGAERWRVSGVRFKVLWNTGRLYSQGGYSLHTS
jgi:hypothetical protein